MGRPDDDQADPHDTTAPPGPPPPPYAPTVDWPLLEAHRTFRQAQRVLYLAGLHQLEEMRGLRRRLDSDPQQQEASRALWAALEEFLADRSGGDEEPVTSQEWARSTLHLLVTGRSPTGTYTTVYSPSAFPVPVPAVRDAVAARTRSDFLRRLEEAGWNYMDAVRHYPDPLSGGSSAPPVLVVNDPEELATALRTRAVTGSATDQDPPSPGSVLAELAEARAELQFLTGAPMVPLRGWLLDRGRLTDLDAAAHRDPWGMDPEVEERLQSAGFPPSMSLRQQSLRARRVADPDQEPVEAGLQQLAELTSRLLEVTGASSLGEAVSRGHEERGKRDPEHLRVVSGGLPTQRRRPPSRPHGHG